MNIELVDQSKFISKTTSVDEAEKEMLGLPQVSCPVVHRFGPGIYMREVLLQKGSLVVGHHQNFEHMNIFLKGRITFYGDKGPIEMTAPMMFVGKPGRKIAYIHEDSVWINVYATNETDVEKLEAHFLTKSDAWAQDQAERRKVLLLTSSVDHADYLKALSEFGFDPKIVREISEKTDDMIDLPFGAFKIKTGKSQIEGTGLFATADIEPGEIIAPSRVSGKRTIAGRYTNHSAFPNAKMIRASGSDINLVATSYITGCHGGQDGQEITIDYREALKLTLEIGRGE